MKVAYIESENSIEIKDGIKTHYLILKFAMFLNLGNALIRLIEQKMNEYGAMEYFWIIVGILSLIGLYFLFFKKSSEDKIKIEHIKRLNEKSILGVKIVSLKLENGRNRFIGNFRNEFELVKIRELFSNLNTPK